MPAKHLTFLGALAAAIVVSICAAQAATVADTLGHFKLLGSWAGQCNAPATIDNNHRIYAVVSADVVRESNDLGPDYEPNNSSITAAQQLSPDQLQFTSTLDNGITRTLIILKHGNTIRTMSNIRADGTVLVKDGVVQSNGNMTPVMMRCD